MIHVNVFSIITEEECKVFTKVHLLPDMVNNNNKPTDMGSVWV
jgi:hypothetical protein